MNFVFHFALSGSTQNEITCSFCFILQHSVLNERIITFALIEGILFIYFNLPQGQFEMINVFINANHWAFGPLENTNTTLQSTDTWQSIQSTKTPKATQSIELPKPSSLLNSQNQLS